MSAPTRTVGELLTLLHERFMAEYGDEELASIATAAVLNDLLSLRDNPDAFLEEAA